MTGGIVRGAGKQVVGAMCNLVCFYFIGFPIGVSLMFPVKMGIIGEDRFNVHAMSDIIIFQLKLTDVCVTGLWSGFLLCASLQSVFFIVFLCKLNWIKTTEEVSPILFTIHIFCATAIVDTNYVRLKLVGWILTF